MVVKQLAWLAALFVATPTIYVACGGRSALDDDVTGTPGSGVAGSSTGTGGSTTGSGGTGTTGTGGSTGGSGGSGRQSPPPARTAKRPRPG